MRVIDADAVLARYYAEYEQQDICDGSEDRDWLMKCLAEVPTLTQPNEPLTFVERREMDRKPIWLDDEKAFGILQFWDDNNVDAVFLDPSGCICVKSVIGKKIYRRPPEGEEETP